MTECPMCHHRFDKEVAEQQRYKPLLERVNELLLEGKNIQAYEMVRKVIESMKGGVA